MFYSPSTRGFYDEAIHGARHSIIIDPAWVHPVILIPDPQWNPDEHEAGAACPLIEVLDPEVIPPTIEISNPDCKIPVDAVEITAAEHAVLLEAQSAGRLIQPDETGRPVAVDPPPPGPPNAVTMRQARLALLQQGLLAQVDAAIAAMPSPQKEAAQIEWEFAAEVVRGSALVVSLDGALGLTEAQLDALFSLAATL